MAQEITLKEFPELETVVKALVDFCDKNHYTNPRIVTEITIHADGRKFKLIFERTNLD